MALGGALVRRDWQFRSVSDNEGQFRTMLTWMDDTAHVHKASMRVVMRGTDDDGNEVVRSVGTFRGQARGPLQRRLKRSRGMQGSLAAPMRVDPRATGYIGTNRQFDQSTRDRLVRSLSGRFTDMIDVLMEEYCDIAWSLNKVTLSLFRARMLSGGAYAELPPGLRNRYCVANPATDRHCLAYCIAMHQQPNSRHRGRLSQYALPDLPAEVALKDIPKVERRLGVLINVYGVTQSGKTYAPFLVYPHDKDAVRRDPAEVIPVILHNEHYSLITNFSQFAQAKTGQACMACLSRLAEPWESHREVCSKFAPLRMVRARTPTLQFADKGGPTKVVVADFESMLPADGKHVACAWALRVLGGGMEEGFGPTTVPDFVEAVMAHASELTVCAFHNLRGYDSHLILRYLADEGSPYRLDILPMSSEKVIGFTLKGPRGVVRFIDSVALMPQSLDTLMKSCGVGTKMHYPYEYFTGWDRYNETELPPREAFYSSVSEKGITEEEHAEAQALFATCRDLRDFTMLYVRADVDGLAEVLTRHRQLMRETYGIDCCAYWSSPGCSWDAMLKHTGVAVDTIAPDMYQWLESGVRGGLSVVSRHVATAAGGSVTYFDANNLYGWAMREPLPVGGYEWVDAVTPAEGYGHILEVDLEYPARLHTEPAHQQYPLAVDQHECESGPKLCGTFLPKERYVVHERALAYYVSKGLVVTKTHKVLRFREEPWLRPYIDKNSELRAAGTTDFESDFYKLMNNSVFGKTLESTRNRCSCKAFTDRDKFERYVAKNNFVDAVDIGPHLVLGMHSRAGMVCNKVPAVGLTILDLSKLHMSKFHHDVVAPTLPNSVLCATDTDSFFYYTPGMSDEQVYDALAPHLDTSNFPPEHRLYSVARKKVPGYFKSEVPPPDRITEGVWLRAKMYSLQVEHVHGPKCKPGCKGASVTKAKGINRSYVKNHITHADFKECFESREDQVTKPHRKIASTKHNLETITFEKIGLSCRDDKRVQLGSIHTLPFGAVDDVTKEFVGVN